MTREEIEKIVWKEFVEFTGVNGAEDLNLEVFTIKRENFVRRLRIAFPELRLRNSSGKKSVEDFVDALFAEQIFKEKFCEEVLALVKKLSGNSNYTSDSRLYGELRQRENEPISNARQSEDVKYFLRANKIFTALSRKTNYYPDYTLMAKTKNIRELAELFYRRGQF